MTAYTRRGRTRDCVEWEHKFLALVFEDASDESYIAGLSIVGHHETFFSSFLPLEVFGYVDS